MIIKNLEKLAKTPLRRDALEIVEAGYESIAIESIFHNNISFHDDLLSIAGQTFDLSEYKDIYVVGVGKGSALAAKQIEDILGAHRIKSGIVIDITRRRLKKIRSLSGTHPLPSESMAAQQSAVVGACHRVHALPEIRHMVKPHQIKQSVREP